MYLNCVDCGGGSGGPKDNFFPMGWDPQWEEQILCGGVQTAQCNVERDNVALWCEYS